MSTSPAAKPSSAAVGLTVFAAVMLISVWVQLGYQMTVFLAGLQAGCLDFFDLVAQHVDPAGGVTLSLVELLQLATDVLQALVGL